MPTPDSWKALSFSTLVTMALAGPLTTMIFSGALERHPGLRLVLAEAGLGWVPYVVNRMDQAAEKRTGMVTDYVLQSRPSEIFRGQVFVTFEEERQRRRLRRDARRRALHVGQRLSPRRQHLPRVPGRHRADRLDRLSPADCRRITADNCRRLYGFAEVGTLD